MALEQHVFADQLRSAIDALPRTRLAHLPTPLDECPRLARALVPDGRAPAVYVKRDDLTGLGTGGNKVRHFEFRIGDALASGCDTLIYVDDANAGRAAAAASARAGLRYVQVVPVGTPPPSNANLMLSRISGADLHFVPVSGPRRIEAHQFAAEIEANLRREGRRPYRMQALPMFDLSGVVSYMLAALEMADQFSEAGIGRANLFTVTGHGHAGLHYAAKLLNLPWSVRGVGVDQAFEPDRPLAEWAARVAELLSLPARLTDEEIVIDSHYAAPGYHQPSNESIEAVKLAARTEGLILDPAYTGKAMAALIDHVRSGAAAPGTAIVFVHTGGLPMLFDNADRFD